MSTIYLPKDACKSRIREAENARKNRLEIVKAYSQGQISRRDIFKWGLVTGAGLIAPIGGLSPFARGARADSGGIPTGAAPSPLFGAQPFTQPMLRLEVLNPAAATCVDDPTGGQDMIVTAAKLRAHRFRWGAPGLPDSNRCGSCPRRWQRALRRTAARRELGTSILDTVRT